MSEWEKLLLKNSTSTITFVCSGNVIRSPYAEYLSKLNFTDKRIIFDSGACFYQNRKIFPLTKKWLMKENLLEEDIDNHKPRLISNFLKDFETTTLFIAMTKEHEQYLKRHWPEKTFLLKKIVMNKDEDVLDPYDYPEKENEIMKELKKLTIEFCRKLENIRTNH